MQATSPLNQLLLFRFFYSFRLLFDWCCEVRIPKLLLPRFSLCSGLLRFIKEAIVGGDEFVVVGGRWELGAWFSIGWEAVVVYSIRILKKLGITWISSNVLPASVGPSAGDANELLLRGSRHLFIYKCVPWFSAWRSLGFLSEVVAAAVGQNIISFDKLFTLASLRHFY